MAFILIRKIAELLCYLVMGFLLVRLHVLRKEDTTVITKLSVNLIMPFSILAAFLVPYSTEVMKGIGVAFLAYALIKAVVLPASSLYGKLTGGSAVEVTSIGYSNVGNLVLPIVGSVLGQEWMVYVAGAIIVNNALFWMHGIAYFSGERKFNAKKYFLNMNILCIMVGFLLFTLRISLPDIVQTAVKNVGNMIGPVSMLITGMILGGMTFREVFANKRIFPVTGMRMIVMPFLAILVLRLTRLDRLLSNGETILLIVLLSELTPPANVVNQNAVLYGKEPEYASAIQVFSTLVSIVTMPLMVWVFQTLMEMPH